MDSLSLNALILAISFCLITPPAVAEEDEEKNSTIALDSSQQLTENKSQESQNRSTQSQSQDTKIEPLELKNQIRIDANIALPQDI